MTSEPEENLPLLVQDKEYQRAFLKLTRNLAPTVRSFTLMEIASSGDGDPATLTQDSRKLITASIRRREETPDSRKRETLKGVLRAVHLDKDWIDLLVDGTAVHIIGVGEALDDVIGPMVDHTVNVRVTKDMAGKYYFQDMELDDAG